VRTTLNKLRIAYTGNVRDPSKAADSVIDVGPDIFHVLERRRSELDLVFNNAESPHTASSPKTLPDRTHSPAGLDRPPAGV
jgi:hypothetical protein